MNQYEQDLHKAHLLLSDELIATTPEGWKMAVLQVDNSNKTVVAFTASISSPEGKTDTLDVTLELRAAIQGVIEVFRRHKKEIWSTLTFEVIEEGVDRWRFKSHYSYDRK